MKYYLILLLLIFFISCSRDDKPPQTQKNQPEQSDDNPSDTNLTPEEKFSSAIMADFLNESDDENLADFLETTVYQMSLSYTGVSVVEISPAVWLIMFEKEGVTKNYLLQKFLDITSNDYFFRMNETTLKLTDIIGKGNGKPPAGQ